MKTRTFPMEIMKQRVQSLRMKIRNANVDSTIKVREIETGFSQSETTTLQNAILLRVGSD